jgi:hypothetical protein
MGVCQANIPCSQIINAKIDTQSSLNYINKKNIPIKENKNLITEDAGVSNEGIKIAFPARSFSSTKITSRNLIKTINDPNFLIKGNNKKKRKSLNLTTVNKTPSTFQNYNTSNDNCSKKNNKIEINNFGLNNLNNNISTKKFGNKKSNNNIMLNSLISNVITEKCSKNNCDKKEKINSHNIDNNIGINDNDNDNTNKKEKGNNSFENLQIEDIISEEKIHTKNNIEVVFRGNLLLVNSNGNLDNRLVYCVMSRIKLKLYNNIHFFLRMKKPLFIIDLHSVKDIHIFKDEYFGLCFSLLDKYILTSYNKEQLFKWIVVLNYFSSKLKE